ncbi:hypothetical protein BD560DRAFT_477046 [Blakeslea trispora]|nr:hypothetical protein BD560DRAFT_477046 [Blakeslea trispora]
MKLGLISLFALASIASVAKAGEAKAHDFVGRLLHIQPENTNEAQQELLNRIDNAKISDELCAGEENVMLCTVDSLVKNIGLELESYGVPNTAEEIDATKFDEILSRILGVSDPFVFKKYEAYVQSISAESIPHDELLTVSEDNLFTKIADSMNSVMKNVPDMKLSKIVAPFLIKDPENRSGAISSLMQMMSLDQDAVAKDEMFKDVREVIAKTIKESADKGQDKVLLNLTMESLLDLNSDSDETKDSKDLEDDIEESAVDAEDEQALEDADAIEAETTGDNVEEEDDEEEESDEEAVAFLDSNDVAPAAESKPTIDERVVAMRAVLRTTLGEILGGLIGDLNGILEGVKIGANVTIGVPPNITAGINIGVNNNNQSKDGIIIELDPSLDVDLNAGVNVNANPSVSVGVNPGVNVDLNPGVNVGVNPGVNVGVNPGVNVDLNPGVNVGVNPGISVGGNSGINIDLNPDINLGLGAKINV